MVYNWQRNMKEYTTEGELLKISEKESLSWIGKQSCVILKDGNQKVSGMIENVLHSNHPNTPSTSDFLWYRIDIDGKHYFIDKIKTLIIFD